VVSETLAKNTEVQSRKGGVKRPMEVISVSVEELWLTDMLARFNMETKERGVGILVVDSHRSTISSTLAKVYDK
jgi:hypothetical protein